MKYDASIVGEEVLSGEKKGKVTKAGKDGVISIKFAGERQERGYLFDPFVGGFVKFVNPELQKAVDEEIEGIRQEQLKTLNACLAKKGEKEDFYVTKDNPDGSKEVIYRIKGEREQAFVVFSFVVQEQVKEYRKPTNTKKWRIVRLFDAKTGEQLAQES